MPTTQVYRALLLTLRDPELVADAVHEALARALAQWEQVSTYANPVGWVYRVALNWARSRLRRLARELLTGQPPERRPAADVAAPSDPAVALALRGLPVEQRAVVILRLYLDWSIEEVAAALALPPGTVKSRLSRALDRLRERLEESS
jgi:RNA polymerase sigma factor (sigma-70 family)